MNYTLFILFALGVSYGISTEMITLPFRSWVFRHSEFLGQLVSCNICTSFWVGTLLGIFFTPLFPVIDGFIVMAVMKIVEKLSN